MTYQLLVELTIAIMAGNGILQFLINRYDSKHSNNDRILKELERNSNATKLCLKSDIVILKALHDGHINGESEQMRKELDDFLTRSCI